MISIVVFDLYGTLVDILTDETDPGLWQTVALFMAYNGAAFRPAELEKAYHEKAASLMEGCVDKAHPEFDILLLLKQLYETKGLNSPDTRTLIDTARVFRASSTRRLRLYPGALRLLDNLKSRGCHIYLLSNGQRCFSEPEMRLLGIQDHFEKTMFSSDVLTAKPGELIFMKLAEECHFSPTEAVMIGNDHECDIAGSAALGFHSVYVHSNLSPPIKGTVVTPLQLWDGDLPRIAGLLESL